MSTTTAALGDLLHSKYARLSQQQKSRPVVSIENTGSTVTTNNSIEIPQEIDDLIDNKAYRNKFKSLIKKGHLNDLLELAKIARANATKEAPSHWFARATRTTPLPGYEGEPTYWQRSLANLAKLRKVAQQAAYTAQKLGVKVAHFLRYIYKQVWRGVNTIRWACLAAETPHQKPGQGVLQYFAWLCLNEKRLTV